VSHLAKHISH